MPNSSMAKRRTTRLPRGLWLHANGQFAAKIRYQTRYFGADRDEAIRRYEHEAPHLRRGEVPPPLEGDIAEYVSIDELVNRFLEKKERDLQAGDIGPRMFQSYMDVARNVKQVFGAQRKADDLRPHDFGRLRLHLAKRYSVRALSNRMTWIKSIFKYGESSGLLDHAPRYGDEFNRPTRQRIRQHQLQRHSLFSRNEVLALLEGAGQPMKSMILLALNAGLGQTDLANLPWSAIDFSTGWLDYGRRKTGIPRRVPLWKETMDSLSEWRAERPTPANAANNGLVFVTEFGNRFVREVESSKSAGLLTNIDGIAQEFRKLQNKAKVRKAGRGFYSLRHLMANVGFQAGDSDAVRAILGHVESDVMRSNYVLAFEGDERLRRVVQHVHDWLFPPKDRSVQ